MSLYKQFIRNNIILRMISHYTLRTRTYLEQDQRSMLCLLIGAVLEFHELTILPSVEELHVLPGTVSMGVVVPNFGIKTKTQLHSLLHFLTLPRNQSEGPVPTKIMHVIYTVQGKIIIYGQLTKPLKMWWS
jgi:hypothetical protein